MAHGKQKNRQRGLAMCPHCQTPLAAPLKAAGRSARCKACDQRFTLPSAEDMFDDAVAYIVEREESQHAREAFAHATREIQYDVIRGAEIG